MELVFQFLDTELVCSSSFVAGVLECLFHLFFSYQVLLIWNQVDCCCSQIQFHGHVLLVEEFLQVVLDPFLPLRLPVALPLEANRDVALAVETGQGLEHLEEPLGVLPLEAANDPEDEGSRGHPHRSQ